VQVRSAAARVLQVALAAQTGLSAQAIIPQACSLTASNRKTYAG